MSSTTPQPSHTQPSHTQPVPNTFTEEEPRDKYWYKRAVFYEVLIRGFADSNGDGTGDIRGLIEKLDYLQWLGIDCLWLLPLYESPSRTAGMTSRTT